MKFARYDGAADLETVWDLLLKQAVEACGAAAAEPRLRAACTETQELATTLAPSRWCVSPPAAVPLSASVLALVIPRAHERAVTAGHVALAPYAGPASAANPYPLPLIPDPKPLHSATEAARGRAGSPCRRSCGAC